METATQTLHRLTSNEPGREWDEPIDDPLVVQDLEVNNLGHFPWFTKRSAASLEPSALLDPGHTSFGIYEAAGVAQARRRDHDRLDPLP